MSARLDFIPKLERNGSTAVLLKQLPVNDPMSVQEHQSRRDLGSVKAGPRLVKLPRALNLKHQVASVDILHHKEQPVLESKVEPESAEPVYHFWVRSKAVLPS